jgi:hypothetical protein
MNYLTWWIIFFKALRQGIVAESPKRVDLCVVGLVADSPAPMGLCDGIVRIGVPPKCFL